MTKPRILFLDRGNKLPTPPALFHFFIWLMLISHIASLRAADSVLTPAWQIAPGDRPYLSADTVPTGMAYNPNTDDLLLVAGSSGNRIIALDAITGNEKGRMYTDTPLISGGDSSLNVLGLTDDGTIYAANLVSDSMLENFRVYRWDNEGGLAVPALVMSDDPSSANPDADNRRFGDTIAIRGSGPSTQILVGSRDGDVVAILTNPDGFQFYVTTIQTDAPKGTFGQSLAFAEGNSFWAKSANGTLRLLDFNMDSATATTRVTLAASQVSTNFAGISYDKNNKLLAGITLNSPASLRLFDLSDLNHPRIADQGVFPSANPNFGSTLATAFGRGRVFGLDSTNGLIAFTVNSDLLHLVAPAQLTGFVRSGSTNFQFTLIGTPNRDYRVQSTIDFNTWTPVSTVTAGADGTAAITDSFDPAQLFRFYRAINP